jgi:hypothetical protein
MAVSNTMMQTNVDTKTNMKIQISCLQTMERRMNIDKKSHLKRDRKSTKHRSVIKIYCKNMQKHQKKNFCFHLIEDTIVL